MSTYSFNPFPELQTKRLVLRKLTLEDAPELFFLRSDQRVIQHLARKPAESVAVVKEFIQLIQANLEKGESILWAIALNTKPGELIGTICFWNLQPENFRAEIGYVLHPDHWRKGLMKEAMIAVIDYGFQKMKLHSIEARLFAGNDASAFLLEKLSFTRDAYFKEDTFFDGDFLDTLVYSRIVNSV